MKITNLEVSISKVYYYYKWWGKSKVMEAETNIDDLFIIKERMCYR